MKANFDIQLRTAARLVALQGGVLIIIGLIIPSYYLLGFAVLSIVFSLLLIRFRGGFGLIEVWCPICHEGYFRSPVDEDEVHLEIMECCYCQASDEVIL